MFLISTKCLKESRELIFVSDSVSIITFFFYTMHPLGVSVAYQFNKLSREPIKEIYCV